MKIALLQATGQSGQPARNLETLRAAATTAGRRGAAVLVTPELFLSSYDPVGVHDVDGQPARDAVAAVARESALWLAASTVEHEAGRRFISASLFDPAGVEVTRYRKRNLFGEGERALFSTGEDLPEIVDVDGWPTALGLCFDVEFPEFVRAAALGGAELLLVPTAVPVRPWLDGQPPLLDTSVVPLTVVPTRAFESQLYIAYANQCGSAFCGRSTIADPLGRRLVTAGRDAELLVADISEDVLTAAREAVDYLDRVRRASPLLT
ncbi:nitrilase-related carbon-nitrogen hydrolase [Kineococcus rhizosphaerae]|uniref:Putative amidohydrolase n=1 Tax=Kineococcus rhizosphaerae TaxID=559628 RepID=A0A2T0R4M8_9ACTN|nr:nitrilase-related carbon-nitrogen hydrolase [Kineococcus rhizosphaerae]PRY15316.1 putative amidohydrolase [Kineococcus rhizosphaerae]